MKKRQKSSGGKHLNEGVHDVVITERETKQTKNGEDFFIIRFANGDRKGSFLVFPPRPNEKYDPSLRNNRINEEFFRTVFGLELDPASEDYAGNLALGYGLVAEADLVGLHAKVVLGYSGLHAKYIPGEKASFMLCTKSGDPMKGYEGKKFPSRDAVKAELDAINLTRADKPFRFHAFCEVQSFLEPKENNDAKLAKYFKQDEEVDEDESGF